MEALVEKLCNRFSGLTGMISYQDMIIRPLDLWKLVACLARIPQALFPNKSQTGAKPYNLPNQHFEQEL